MSPIIAIERSKGGDKRYIPIHSDVYDILNTISQDEEFVFCYKGGRIKEDMTMRYSHLSKEFVKESVNVMPSLEIYYDLTTLTKPDTTRKIKTADYQVSAAINIVYRPINYERANRFQV